MQLISNNNNDNLELQQQLEQQQTLVQQLATSLSLDLDAALPVAKQIEHVQQHWATTHQSTQTLAAEYSTGKRYPETMA